MPKWVISAGVIATIAATYQGAQHGIPWLGLAVVAIVAPVLMTLAGDLRRRLLVFFATGTACFLTDTVLIACGVYSAAKSRWLLPWPFCPEWILALTLNYGLALFGYAHMMRRSLIVTVIVSAAFAAMIYGGAFRRELLRAELPGYWSLFAICGAWAVLNPVLAFFVGRVTGTPPATVPETKPVPEEALSK